MFTTKEVAKKWKTDKGRYEISEALAKSWWDGMGPKDAEKYFIDGYVNGTEALIKTGEKDIVVMLNLAKLISEQAEEARN